MVADSAIYIMHNCLPIHIFNYFLFLQSAMDENQIKEKVEEMRGIVEKQEERIQNLQSEAFELANFYFLFQGVILTAVSRASISHPITCSVRWLFFILSLLAATVNLLALFTIGHKYIKTLSQQHENKLDHHEVVQRLHQLRRDQGQSQSPHASNSESPVLNSKDFFKEAKHYLAFVICILLFLGFAGVTIVGCLKIPCSKNGCRRLPDNENCINLCDGPKCIKVCSEY